MSATGIQQAVEPAYSALAELRLKESALATAQLKLQEIEAELAAAKTKRSRLMELEDQDAALRHVDGEEAAPAKPQRTKELAAIQSKIPALAAAIPLQKTHIAERRAEVETARLPYDVAILDAIVAIQSPALERVRALMADLEQSFVELMAAGMLQEQTIGDSFRVPDGKAIPFASGAMVANFLKNLPARFRPDELEFNRIRSAARQESAAAIQHIQEIRK
jgi:hypothetical protein